MLWQWKRICKISNSLFHCMQSRIFYTKTSTSINEISIESHFYKFKCWIILNWNVKLKSGKICVSTPLQLVNINKTTVVITRRLLVLKYLFKCASFQISMIFFRCAFEYECEKDILKSNLICQNYWRKFYFKIQKLNNY